jgi:hypothetical protein
MTLARRLFHAGADADFVAWAEPFGEDALRALAGCQRGDWAMAIASLLDVPRPALVIAACDVAMLAVELADPDAVRPAIEGVAAARAWAENGTVPDDELLSECEALTGHHDALVHAAAAAAVACLRAIDRPEVASRTSSSAIYAAPIHAGDCAASAATGYVVRKSAELVRAALATHGGIRFPEGA